MKLNDSIVRSKIVAVAFRKGNKDNAIVGKEMDIYGEEIEGKICRCDDDDEDEGDDSSGGGGGVHARHICALHYHKTNLLCSNYDKINKHLVIKKRCECE